MTDNYQVKMRSNAVADDRSIEADGRVDSNSRGATVELSKRLVDSVDHAAEIVSDYRRRD